MLEPGEGNESQDISSLDKATSYVADHPLFGPEKTADPPAAPDPAAPPAEPKPPDAPATPPAPKPADGAAPAAPKPGEPPAPAAPKPGEPVAPGKPGEDVTFKVGTEAAKTLDEIKALPYFNDATFQKLFNEHQELSVTTNAFRELFSQGRYTIENTETLRGVLEDSFALYDMGNLKDSPATLLERFKENYPAGNVNAVFTRIAQWLAEKGFKAEDVAKANDPQTLRLTALEHENAERKKTERETQTRQASEETQQAQKKAYDQLESHITELAKKEGISDAEEILDYLTVIVAQIGGKKEHQDQILAGKWAGIDKMFNDYHSRLSTRMQRWNEEQLRKKEKGNRQPSAPPAGGQPAAVPEAKPKVNLGDPDARRGEALRQFREGGKA